MTYLEKAINLRYIYLTLKLKKISVEALLSAAHTDVFTFIQKVL